MIKSSENCQINIENNQISINGEIGFILIPAYGHNMTLSAYKPAQEMGDPVENVGTSVLLSSLIPALGPLTSIFEGINHIREFSEQIFDNSGKKIDIINNDNMDNRININPKDILNPNLEFLERTPIIEENPKIEYWKQKRLEADENNSENKKKKKKIGLGSY